MARLVEGLQAYELSIVNDPANRLSRIIEYSKETRKGKAVATAEIKDTDGDILSVDSIDLSELASLLWSHRVGALPVGKIINAQKTMYAGVPAVIVDFKVDEDGDSNEDGRLIHRKIVSGSLVGVSLGYDFVPDEPPTITVLDDDDPRLYRNRHTRDNASDK